MTAEEKRERIAYLWKKVRLMVHMRGSIQQMIDDMQMKARECFGLSDDEDERYLDNDQELERQLPFVTDDLTDLPWYLINPESRGAITWHIMNQMINWITLFVIPFILAFNREGQLDKYTSLYYLAWTVDISWVFDITLNFFTADEQNRTFTKISRHYVGGWFIVDFLATVPKKL